MIVPFDNILLQGLPIERSYGHTHSVLSTGMTNQPAANNIYFPQRKDLSKIVLIKMRYVNKLMNNGYHSLKFYLTLYSCPHVPVPT